MASLELEFVSCNSCAHHWNVLTVVGVTAFIKTFWQLVVEAGRHCGHDENAVGDGGSIVFVFLLDDIIFLHNLVVRYLKYVPMVEPSLQTTST